MGSAATAGEGTQNYMCAAQAAAVLLGLAVTAAWPAAWWLDPAIGLGHRRRGSAGRHRILARRRLLLTAPAQASKREMATPPHRGASIEALQMRVRLRGNDIFSNSLSMLAAACRHDQ